MEAGSAWITAMMPHMVMVVVYVRGLVGVLASQ